MTTVKRQISQARQAELENQIAMQNRIMREAQTIMRELDPDSLAYFITRFQRIMRAAAMTKAQLIETMDAEKDAAQAGRE